MFNFLLEDVLLSQIRHNDLRCYRQEGYGGKPITEWPMYQFYTQYLAGKKDEARKNFETWYYDQLLKYHDITKEEGGMYHGSLYTSIERMSGVPFNESSELHKREAITKRVNDRFTLLENIQKYGYRPNAERIDGIRVGSQVYLLGGHHRAAALLALNGEMLPKILVFSNRFMYNLFTILRNIKHGNLQK